MVESVRCRHEKTYALVMSLMDQLEPQPLGFFKRVAAGNFIMKAFDRRHV